MATHKLIFLGFETASFVKLLGFPEQNPSEKETTIDGEFCTIRVWEITGLDESTNQWIYDTEGIVYFYDVTERSSYQRIEDIHHKIQEIKATSTPLASDPATSSATSPLQMILIGMALNGNKQTVFLQEGEELAQKLGCSFWIETATSVGPVLDRIIRLCRQARKAQGASWWGSCFGRGR